VASGGKRSAQRGEIVFTLATIARIALRASDPRSGPVLPAGTALARWRAAPDDTVQLCVCR
jgi:hypothetical protein